MYIAIERAKFNRLLSSHTQSSAKRSGFLVSTKTSRAPIQTDGRL